MRYDFANDIQLIAEDISSTIFPHVKIDLIKCLRSSGSSSRGTIARCHALGKVMQKAMGVKAFYALEFISERFDRLSEEEKVKVIIHELMHIPKTFGGGFKHHDFVTRRNVDLMHSTYLELKKQRENAQKSSFYT